MFTILYYNLYYIINDKYTYTIELILSLWYKIITILAHPWKIAIVDINLL